MNSMVDNDNGTVVNYNNNINFNERYIPLSVILDNAIQRTYHELHIMIETFPATVDNEKY
jgi:hypothetical protein